jgi:pyruvate formate lyase activating enzyme
MEKRRVLEILRMTNHNGPGFRTLVLFKGCPLHCVWCSTPESQKAELEFGIHPGRCSGCDKCLDACTYGAIQKEEEKLWIDPEKCEKCGACAEVCYYKALKTFGQPFTVDELVERIAKDKILYGHSGGGVTLSGGEPLFLQPEYTRDLCKDCQENGITVGIQTCGAVPWRHIEMVLPYVDFFLWDLKHMDSEEHRKYTGAGNEQILENARKVSESGVPMHIRVPVIPGYNDTKENLEATCQFVKQLRNVAAFDLLPVHHLGKIRYETLHRPYSIEKTELISDERMNDLKQFVEQCGVACGVRG